jgi:hypothetical protein
MENHRTAPRLNCEVPIDSSSGNIFAGTQTVDVARGGMGFVSDHEIPVNQQITVELELEKGAPPVFVIGKVLWVKQIPETGQYRIGMSFVDMVKGSKSRLDKYFGK